MISDQFAVQLRTVFQAQHHLLRRLGAELDALETRFDAQADHRAQLDELEQLMDELEAQADDLSADALADFDEEEILDLYRARLSRIDDALTGIGFRDWDSFVKQCQVYDLQHGLDPLAPYEVFLTERDLAKLRAQSYDAKFRWDRWDYLVVGASGVLGAFGEIQNSSRNKYL